MIREGEWNLEWGLQWDLGQDWLFGGFDMESARNLSFVVT
jgi:hypothetical protein